MDNNQIERRLSEIQNTLTTLSDHIQHIKAEQDKIAKDIRTIKGTIVR